MSSFDAPQEPSKRGLLVTETPSLPVRPVDGHKGTFGSVLLVAGSRGMSGAATLCGQAALHGGTGLVTLAVPGSILPTVASAHPSYMTHPMDEGSFPGTPSQVADRHWEDLQPLLRKQTALGVGPGLGMQETTICLVERLYVDCTVPAVFDADALNILARDTERLRHAHGPRVLTPHPGEMARLTGVSTRQIQRYRIEMAMEFAHQHQVVCLLKGHGTIITDGDRYAINQTGGSGLATGGSGDVLTGLIAALLAQGMDAFEAAHLAAHLHGLAGELATETYSAPYVTSLEILHCLSRAWLEAERRPSS